MTSDGAIDDLWSWIDEEPDDDVPNPINPMDVVAVMVVHNAADWIVRQLRALQALNPRPGRIIAVDNGSTDSSRSILEQARAAGVLDAVVNGDPGWGFGQAVQHVLRGDEPWIWLLHDDSAPAPDALGQLLRGAALTNADLLFPKLLQPRRRNYPETLSEIGQTITRSGRRVSSVEEGDIDQGQDRAKETLGGSTAGLLIRGAAWRGLGGLAPELPHHRDGVELGWRAHEAGGRVTTWPEAALTHRQAGMTGERTTQHGVDPHEEDRLAALRLVASRGGKPRRILALVVVSWLRALGFLLLKSPRLAKAEIRAARRLVAEPDRVRNLRSRVQGEPRDVSALLPNRFWPVRNAFDKLGSGIAERYRDFTNQESGISIDEMTGDDYAGGPTRRRVFTPVALLTTLLVLGGAIAARTLLGGGEVFGGGLLPAPDGFQAAWSRALTPVVDTPGANAPWLSIGAFLSMFTLGIPQWLVIAALVLVPLLAALSAHSLLRRLDVTQGTAAIVSGVWAAATLLLGLVTAGDVGGMALAIVFPALAHALLVIVTDESAGAERLRAPAGAAFWLLIGTAAWPLLWVLAAIAGVVWVVLRRHRLVEVLIIVLLPAAFMAPWVPTLVAWPGRMLTGPDPLAWPTFIPADLALFAGRILPSGFPAVANIIFFAVLGLAAAYATARLTMPRQRLLVLLGVGVPVVLGALLSRLAIPVHGGEARPLLSGWALLSIAALLAPIVALRENEERPRTDRRVVLGALTGVACLALGVWVVLGFAGPVTNRPSALPGYVRDVMASPRGTRVLMIQAVQEGRIAWNIVDATQPGWGSGERHPAGSFEADHAALVQLFGGGDAPEDLAERLAHSGISHVWMRGFSAEQLAAVGNAAGLTRNPADDDTVVWTVVGLPSRVRIETGTEVVPVVDGHVEAADSERLLALAEAEDTRWEVRVDGIRLEEAPEGPPVGFTLPAGTGGTLSWGLRPAWGAFGWQVFVLLALIALAAPTAGGATSARRGLED